MALPHEAPIPRPSPGAERPGAERQHAGFQRSLSRWAIKGWLDRIFAWAERARQRRALLELNDALLKDIGLSRADVEREVDKPFWQP